MQNHLEQSHRNWVPYVEILNQHRKHQKLANWGTRHDFHAHLTMCCRFRIVSSLDFLKKPPRRGMVPTSVPYWSHACTSGSTLQVSICTGGEEYHVFAEVFVNKDPKGYSIVHLDTHIRFHVCNFHSIYSNQLRG